MTGKKPSTLVAAGWTVSGLCLWLASICGSASPIPSSQPTTRPDNIVRFATFNTALNRPSADKLAEDLSGSHCAQAHAVAEIIQRVNPDVVLLNEFDYDRDGRAIELFQKNYLGVAHEGTRPIHFQYIYASPVNTGEPSGHDLNRDGHVGGPEDSFGYGAFPGQYGMVLLSRYPIDVKRTRTFQKLLWKDMPNAMLPDDPKTPTKNDWYDRNTLAVLRLSSKNHWDVPIRIGDRVIHILASHPTPPIFDGPEDRNGRRNHDEIRFWYDYLTPAHASYIYSDQGTRGGLSEKVSFVLMGDLNADVADGADGGQAIGALVAHPRIGDRPAPASEGGVEASLRQGGVNVGQHGPAACDTGDFQDSEGGPGNLRLDYVLPSVDLRTVNSGVFWPKSTDPLYRLVGNGYPIISSDHRMVYIDVALK